jgi:hypothetical protein
VRTESLRRSTDFFVVRRRRREVFARRARRAFLASSCSCAMWHLATACMYMASPFDVAGDPFLGVSVYGSHRLFCSMHDRATVGVRTLVTSGQLPMSPT